MQSKSQLTNFENIEDKFANVVSSEEYQQLVNLFQKHDEIYVVANGGLHYVASHMATDISRLVESNMYIPSILLALLLQVQMILDLILYLKGGFEIAFQKTKSLYFWV